MAGALNLTEFVTLKGVNQIYSDLRHRISNIGTIYHVKGSKTWSQLMALVKADQGDVYNLMVPEGTQPSNPDYPPDARMQDGSNIICIRSFSSAINPADWASYWDVAGGLIEVATEDTAGVIKLGNNITDDTQTMADVTTTTAVRGLKLDANDKAFVEIPVANKIGDTYTYGLINTGNQIMKGTKTLNGDFNVTGNVEYSNTQQGTINNLVCGTLKMGNVVVTGANGVITFTV